MAIVAHRTLQCQTSVVWRVLGEVSRWPTWVESIEAVELPGEVAEGGVPTEVRIEQPPLPSTVWTVTDWRVGSGFAWESRAAATLLSERYELTETGDGVTVSIDVTWSGRAAWFARATYGPIRQRYADDQIAALAEVCLGKAETDAEN